MSRFQRFRRWVRPWLWLLWLPLSLLWMEGVVRVYAFHSLLGRGLIYIPLFTFAIGFLLDFICCMFKPKTCRRLMTVFLFLCSFWYIVQTVYFHAKYIKNRRSLVGIRIKIAIAVLGINSQLLKKTNGVLSSESFNNLPWKGRIVRMVAGWLLHQIGEITSSITCGQNFFADSVFMFNQCHFRMVGSGGDGGHHSRCAATDDSYMSHGWYFLMIRFVLTGLWLRYLHPQDTAVTAGFQAWRSARSIRPENRLHMADGWVHRRSIQ